MIKVIKSWLTMRRQECIFVDAISGEEVFRYVDCYGQEWMANYNPFFFRVKSNQGAGENG